MFLLVGRGWRVDPDLSGLGSRSREAAREPLWMFAEGALEHLASMLEHFVCEPVVHLRRREEAQRAVVMFVVVSAKERASEGKTILQRAAAIGKLRPILHGLELALAERIVVGHVGSAVRLGNPQVGQ